ncbi:MAG: hypothetical protein Q4P18_07280 [Methanobrevibacter sp.]|uniref:hypothetical protein n=1 Tax=Methanobrevibacter sp. TaxID=66852 RepID=UPI0026DEE52A|nr:hypothetical protein [Methanobrevibacter sp.]MDO5849320.1 hypothetical protein [Methanobrevibacter sp.]
MLPADTESESYRFYKSLNEDILLKPNEFNEWDMQFENGDVVNVTGYESLQNAICIAIMTRFKELKNPLYADFGCRIHELIKANKSRMVEYKIELFITEVLTNMRRVKKINWIKVTDNPNNEFFKYLVEFSVTSIYDKIVEGEVNL